MPKFKYVVTTKQTLVQHLDYEFDHDNPNLTHEQIMEILYNDGVEGTPIPFEDSVIDEVIRDVTRAPIKEEA